VHQDLSGVNRCYMDLFHFYCLSS